MDYLGYVKRPHRLKIVTHTTDAIKALKPAAIITELPPVHGMLILVRRRVSIFARIVALLNKKMKKYQPKHFSALPACEIKATHQLQKYWFQPR